LGSFALYSEPLVLDQPDALDSVAEDWGRLWEATRPMPPMLEYRWIRTWWKLHHKQSRLLLIVARDVGGRPIGLAPLYLRRSGYSRDPLGLLRTVHFLGTGEREADEIAGEYLSWLAPPEAVDAVTRLVGQVLRERADDWDRVRLVNVRPEQDLHLAVPRELAAVAQHVTVAPRPAFRIAVRPLEDYLTGLESGNFRHRCRRALRAGAEAGVELVTVTRPDEAQSLFSVLARLHQRRWIERGKPGAFDSPLFREFHEQVMPSYIADGSGWLAGLRQGDRWLAARYHLRTGDRVFDYLSGVDVDTPAALGPGLLLTLHGLEWCARNGVETYDLLAGDYEYKQKLATTADEIFEVDVFNSSLPAQLWLAARRLRSKWRAATAATATAR
jgi:CelD/BcsL family acetyltransferase involved in cellulose biosynthesis